METKANSDLDVVDELSSSSSSSPENIGWAQTIQPSIIQTQDEAPEPFWEDICTPNEFYFVKAKGKINGDGEGFEKIPQMEATCKMCSLLLQEEISVLKPKCRCKLSLMHEQCYTEFSANKQIEDKCDVCREIVIYIPVTLSRSDEPEDLAVDVGGTVTSQMLECSNRPKTWFSKLFGYGRR